MAVAAPGEEDAGREGQDAQARQGHDAVLCQRRFEEAERRSEEGGHLKRWRSFAL